jgi:hypothetical protein
VTHQEQQLLNLVYNKTRELEARLAAAESEIKTLKERIPCPQN